MKKTIKDSVVTIICTGFILCAIFLKSGKDTKALMQQRDSLLLQNQKLKDIEISNQYFFGQFQKADSVSQKYIDSLNNNK